MSENNWDLEKKKFISELKQTESLFEELFKVDKDEMVIGKLEKEHLKELQSKNRDILRKLDKEEFEVAIIGVENTGKSTLGNALIKRIVLPEYTERCTYTKTEIRAGEEDKTIVTFYSTEEFQSYLKDMFNSVGYSGNAAGFDSYWKGISQSQDKDKQKIYKDHNTTTVEDIYNILKGYDTTIKGLLDHSPMEFKNSGIKDFNVKPIQYTPEPYAVKEVKITSTQLGDMKNIILYDVPGFDSPTELHRKQTEDMLSKSDAIIFVTNIGDKPNLNKLQLDVLNKKRDDDDIYLSEKSFIFGNKIDTAGNVLKAKDNIETLESEAVKYNIARKDRVVCGSAKAYLEKEKLFSEDDKARGLTEVDKKLEEWGISDGRDELFDKMNYYYHNDRFKVIKKRAQNILKSIKEFLNEILEKYSLENLNKLDSGEEIILKIKDKVNVDFIKEAKIINDDSETEIRNDKPFSSKLIDDLLIKIFPKMDFWGDMLSDIEKERITDTTGNYPSILIDAALRERLKQKLLENIVQHIATITSERQDEIRDKLVEQFLITIEADSEYFGELKDSVNKLFDELLITNGSKCHFNILVERFSAGLIETLIGCPFASSDRRKSLNLIQSDIFHLASYYYGNEKMLDDSKKPYLSLFGKILTHNENYLNEDDDIKVQLDKFTFDLKDKDDIIKCIDQDIDILNDISQKSLIEAIGLEQAFINVITKNINLIRFNLKDESNGREKLNKWIADNKGKIKPTEFKKIDKEYEKNQIRKSIVKSIIEIQSNWKDSIS